MTTYYDIDKVKLLLYRAPAGKEGTDPQEYEDQTISIGTEGEGTNQITEADATVLAEDAQLEILAQVDSITGHTDRISYAVNRLATAYILYLVYNDVVAEDNAKWQYAKKLEKQANNMIGVINKKDDMEAGLPLQSNKTTDPVFSIKENTRNANMDRDYNTRT